MYAGPSDFGAGQLAGLSGGMPAAKIRVTRIILGRLGMEKSVEKRKTHTSVLGRIQAARIPWWIDKTAQSSFPLALSRAVDRHRANCVKTLGLCRPREVFW